MRAVVLSAGKPELRDVDIPRLSDGDVLVEMRACGLCGTDLEKMSGKYTASQPVLGHEPAGIVAESLNPRVKRGVRVFAHHHVPCYECYYCVKGSPTMCPHYRATNLDPGGFAEYFRVPRFNVDRGGILELPQHVTFEEGALIEPLATVLRAQKRGGIQRGDSVLVVGVGPMGDMHIMAASHAGAGLILASDLNEHRLSFASKLGAHHTIKSDENLPEEARKLTDGRGVDVAIVASGSPKAIVSALKSTRKGGRIILFGVPYKGSTLDYDVSDLLNNELSIIPSNAAVEEDTVRALELISKREINVAKIVSNRYTLDEFHRAVTDSLEGRVIKAIIVNNAH
ncbi:MAG: zinc-dependent dehydrogenase [Thermoprotei archaeon]